MPSLSTSENHSSSSKLFLSILGSGMINAPLSSAASRLLSDEDPEVGMGLLSGANFMGGGIGAAITGAWLNARQRANAPAINPVYTGDGSAWSDGFLAVVVMVGFALAIASMIRTGKNG